MGSATDRIFFALDVKCAIVHNHFVHAFEKDTGVFQKDNELKKNYKQQKVVINFLLYFNNRFDHIKIILTHKSFGMYKLF